MPRPVLSRPDGLRFALGGVLGDRLAANEAHWLLTAPDANPAMLEMFRDRDRQPARDLVPWAGEFAGKYLTAGVLVPAPDRQRGAAARTWRASSPT